MAQEESNVVELIGEDGTPVLFEHLMTLEHEGDTFIMLTPVEPETPDEEGSVVVMRITKDEKGEDCYIIEEDEDKAEAVFEKFIDLMDEEEDGDDLN